MHTTKHIQPEFIKIPEAAKSLDTSRELIYRLIREGQIKSYSFGRKCLRVRRSDLQEYIEKSIQG